MRKAAAMLGLRTGNYCRKFAIASSVAISLGLLMGLSACTGDQSTEEPVAASDDAPPAIPDAPGDAGETAEKPAGQGQVNAAEQAESTANATAPNAQETTKPAQPSAATSELTVTSSVSFLNVREGPGMSHSPVRTLKGGEKVMVVECKLGWCQIGSGEYVAQKFLSE